MSEKLNPLDLIVKAERASASAFALLDMGDVDGASNRAYYAMFDAARSTPKPSATLPITKVDQ